MAVNRCFEYFNRKYTIQTDRKKQNRDYEIWRKHEELFRNKEVYHREYFNRVKAIFEDNIERGLLEWNISEQDKFHLICEIIDVFKKGDSNYNV